MTLNVNASETAANTNAINENITTKYFIDRLVDEAESNKAWLALREAGEAVIAKNAKKTGLEKLATETRDGVLRVSPALLSVEPGFNERDLNTKEAADKLLELALSIKAEGVRQVLVIKKDGDSWNIEDGHRRFYATMLAVVRLGAEIRTIPVRMGDKNASDADRVFSQYILNSGERPTPFEMGGIFSRLIKMGWTETEVVSKTGLSKSRVSQLLDMHRVPADVKALARHPDIVLKPSFIYDRFLANKKDGAATVSELMEAISIAKEGGYDRATAKHLPDTAAEGASHRRAKGNGEGERAAPPIVAGTPADGLPLPATNPQTETPPAQAAAPEAPNQTARAPVVQTDRNRNMRTALKDFFTNFIEVADYERGTKKPISIKLKKSAITEEMWVMIRDGLDI